MEVGRHTEAAASQNAARSSASADPAAPWWDEDVQRVGPLPRTKALPRTLARLHRGAEP